MRKEYKLIRTSNGNPLEWLQEQGWEVVEARLEEYKDKVLDEYPTEGIQIIGVFLMCKEIKEQVEMDKEQRHES